MYAIIRSGGRQFRVEPGDTIHVDRLEAEVGASVTLGDVLLVGGSGETRVGNPRVEAATVTATVVEHGRDAKIRILKYKKRKHYRRTRGHRQSFTVVKIDAVQA